MAIQSFTFPKPDNYFFFESFCLKVFRSHLKLPHIKKFALSGHRQYGVDLLSTRPGRIVGIQCKLRNTSSGLTIKEMNEAIELAKTFSPALDELIIATTADRNPALDTHAIRVNEQHKAAGLFSVQIYFWQDIEEILKQDTALATELFSRARYHFTGQEALRWGKTALGIALLATMVGSSPAALPEWRASFPAASSQRSKVPLPRSSVAVMTFANRSGDRKLDWLSTALADAVSAKLGVTGDIHAVNRYEVSLAETDLRLASRAKPSPQDLARIRGLLGVEFVLGGFFDHHGGRLSLTLYDSKDRVVARTTGDGKASDWFDLSDRSSEGVSGCSLRQRLKGAPLTRSQRASLRALFPIDSHAAESYFRGLERYRHFDIAGASALFGRSVLREPHPLVLAALADTNVLLGQSEESRRAIQKARRLEEQNRKTRALPEMYRREIEIIERKVAAGEQGAAETIPTFFREYFADDLSYGLLAAQALIAAGSADQVKPLLEELRFLPLAEKHPGIDLLQADALFVQQLYPVARIFANTAILKAQDLGAVRQEALARLQLASILSLMGRGAEARQQFRQAREGFERTADHRSAAQCLELTAIFYVNFDLLLALDLYTDAVNHYKALGDRRQQARALFGLSAVLTEAGRFSEAEEKSREAAALAPFLEDGLEPFLGGFRAHLAGQLTSAQSQYEIAKKIFELHNQRDDYASTLTNLGEIELTRGRLTNAKALHRQALGIHKKIGSEAAPYDMVGLGRAHAAAGEYPVARIWYDDALNELESDGGTPKEPTAWAEAHLAMAELELLSGNANSSEEQARLVIDRAVVELDAIRSRAFSFLVHRLLDKGKIEEASKASNEAMKLAPGDFRAVREAEIAGARVRAARNEVNPALHELDRIAAAAAESKHVVYELESIFTAGTIERANGLSQGRRRLEALRTRAEDLGFGQIVKRVASALGE